ncbi:MAG: hypothetical protein ABSF03_33735 [Streptosporangiaceae bacterium]
MTGTPQRNQALATWIGNSGRSYQQVADEVCRLACQHRPPLNAAPDSSRISRWVSGEQPRGIMPDLIAEALTGLCGLAYSLSRADIGMATTSPATGGSRLPWHPVAVIKAVLDMTRNDLTSPDPEGTELLIGPDLLDAVRPWLDQAPGELPQPDRPGRIGLADVGKIRATTAAFRAWDNQHGGGLSRDAVVAQLKATTELLYHGRMSDAVGRELFTAVGDLASVAGWMTHDAGRSPEGQRYLLLGLHAASEAGDVDLAAHLLNCLSRVADHLGRTDDALEMVQLAQYGTRKLPPGRIRAVLAALEARYLAITGDISGFHRAAGAAADGLAASSDNDPEWARWFDAAEYHATIGIAHMLAARHQPRLISTAITMTSHAIPLRPAERARSRAFDHIGLARAHVIAGELAGADSAAATAIDIAAGVSSTRLADRMTELDAELAALGSEPAAQQVRDRIRLFL